MTSNSKPEKSNKNYGIVCPNCEKMIGNKINAMHMIYVQRTYAVNNAGDPQILHNKEKGTEHSSYSCPYCNYESEDLEDFIQKIQCNHEETETSNDNLKVCKKCGLAINQT